MRYVLRMARVCALWVIMTALMACAKGGSTLSLPSPSSQFATVTNAYPAVVKVILPSNQGLCTGTFISPRVVLTAAHCTQRSGTYTVVASFGQFTTANRINYGGPATVDDPNDISLLVFSSNVADPSLDQVMNVGSSVAIGDTLRLVGFGCNDLDTRRGSGVKRTGTNVVYDLPDYIEFLTPQMNTDGTVRGILGSENRAGSCFGDSGGPAAHTRAGGVLELVGVAHAGGETSDGLVSDYVDMTRDDNREFLSDVNRDFNLGIVGF